MSYPSINKHLESQNVTVEAATDEQLERAFVLAFQEDLPLGYAKVEELVAKLKEGESNRVMLSLDPNSDEGKQYSRLLGPDIPRKVLEKHFQVTFGFYNCCGGVATDDPENLKMTMQEQISAQHPNFVDC